MRIPATGYRKMTFVCGPYGLSNAIRQGPQPTTNFFLFNINIMFSGYRSLNRYLCFLNSSNIYKKPSTYMGKVKALRKKRAFPY